MQKESKYRRISLLALFFAGIALLGIGSYILADRSTMRKKAGISESGEVLDETENDSNEYFAGENTPLTQTLPERDLNLPPAPRINRAVDNTGVEVAWVRVVENSYTDPADYLGNQESPIYTTREDFPRIEYVHSPQRTFCIPDTTPVSPVQDQSGLGNAGFRSSSPSDSTNNGAGSGKYDEEDSGSLPASSLSGSDPVEPAGEQAVAEAEEKKSISDHVRKTFPCSFLTNQDFRKKSRSNIFVLLSELSEKHKSGTERSPVYTNKQECSTYEAVTPSDIFEAAFRPSNGSRIGATQVNYNDLPGMMPEITELVASFAEIVINYRNPVIFERQLLERIVCSIFTQDTDTSATKPVKRFAHNASKVSGPARRNEPKKVSFLESSKKIISELKTTHKLDQVCSNIIKRTESFLLDVFACLTKMKGEDSSKAFNTHLNYKINSQLENLTDGCNYKWRSGISVLEWDWEKMGPTIEKAKNKMLRQYIAFSLKGKEAAKKSMPLGLGFRLFSFFTASAPTTFLFSPPSSTAEKAISFPDVLVLPCAERMSGFVIMVTRLLKELIQIERKKEHYARKCAKKNGKEGSGNPIGSDSLNMYIDRLHDILDNFLVLPVYYISILSNIRSTRSFSAAYMLLFAENLEEHIWVSGYAEIRTQVKHHQASQAAAAAREEKVQRSTKKASLGEKTEPKQQLSLPDKEEALKSIVSVSDSLSRKRMCYILSGLPLDARPGR